MVDTLLTFSGGLLLALPGFITDLIGLLLLLPFFTKKCSNQLSIIGCGKKMKKRSIYYRSKIEFSFSLTAKK
ncbi:FxsA family protein [Lysinibacillus sp. MHQ-1]|nr:FxsA family protein [Lysinibacillus sp. MHQ-1]